ncbi:MAG: sigma-70 family RNA polymerase sigma factor [Actinobacteria bacterium]|nr:sigma-70 family RNA polymerase sigma factor [Actinomycetota bacterium]
MTEAAAELVLTYGPIILRDARRFSACTEDAEDAYQRALLILMTKGPEGEAADLMPWIRTVVRNEALAIARKHRQTAEVPIEPIAETIPTLDELPEEAASDSFEADLGAEALERLTADQARCLLAYSRGNSYTEIAALTGFSARKVARCMTDGRRAFVRRVTDIESGAECQRIEPLLQRMADGDSYAHVEARPHLRNCAGCRATLRDYREAPSKLAALFPVALLVPVTQTAEVPDAGFIASMHGGFESVWHGAQEKMGVWLSGVHHWIEAGRAKKYGAAALAAAVLTAGGVAVTHGIDGRDGGPARPNTGVRFTGQLFDRIDAPPVQAQPRRPARRRRAVSAPAPNPPPRRKPAAPVAPAQPIGDGSQEFTPEGR